MIVMVCFYFHLIFFDFSVTSEIFFIPRPPSKNENWTFINVQKRVFLLAFPEKKENFHL